MLTCFYFNAQSIANKIGELHDILYHISPDCVLVSESWLHADICDGVLDPKSMYNVIRKDRVASRGGGVCAFVKRIYSVLPITFHDKYSDLELLGIDFVDVKPILRLFVVYRPPYYDYSAVSYAKLLTDCFAKHSTSRKYVHLIVGDFNLPHINWEALTGPDDDVNNTTLNFFRDNGYSQLVNFPTRGSNLLDLVLTDVDMLVSYVVSHPPIGFSDHAALEFTVTVSPISNCDVEQPSTTLKYQWAKTDFQAMSMYLSSIDWKYLVYTNPSGSSMWAEFVRVLKCAIDTFVPSFVYSKSGNKMRKPRHSRAVRKLDVKKRRLWKCLSKSPNDFSLRQKYKDCAVEWRRAVRDGEIRAEECVVAANNLGAFYRFVYKRTTNHCGIGVVMDKSGSPITNDQDKANAFNTYFSSVGVPDNGVIPSCNDVRLCSVLDSIEINETDVLRSINRLKTNSSCGPDGLPPILFKRLKFCLSQPLALIYNQLISIGAVPVDWLTAHIVPVFKKGTAGDTANYRPISLTCVPSKIMERVVTSKILDHLHLNNILSSSQHGFLRRRSTSTNLLECFNDWTVSVQTRQQVTIVYIDFAKAFDVVSHNKLFARLNSYGVRGTVLLWLQNFFTNRTHRTKVGTHLSDIADLISGVVQGSGIGPLMFLVYINELATSLENHGIKIKLFADDVKLYIQIVNDIHVMQLQLAIDALAKWANEWQLSISITKCCVLNVGKTIITTSLSIDGITLPVVKSARDLGVLVSHDLSPSLHISTIVAKAHKRSAAIYRAFTCRNTDVLIRAYLTYVRPLVEHDSIIWSPYTVKDITAIEAVQRRYTKRLPGFGGLSYTERLKRLNLLSLELRRLHADLIYCYKIVFGLTNLSPGDFFEKAPLLSTRGHDYKLYKNRCYTTVRSTFFSERIVNTWNILPADVDFSSLVSFVRTVRLVDLSGCLRCFGSQLAV